MNIIKIKIKMKFEHYDPYVKNDPRNIRTFKLSNV
jgi:hypothetical protein